MEYKYQAIILDKTDSSETDRIYTLYTREAGKMRVVGAGVRKPNAKLAGNLETFTYAEVFVAKNRGRGRIIGALAVENFLRLKGDWPALQKVFFALKIFGRLITQEEKDEATFDLLADYLSAMDKGVITADEDKLEILTLGFVFKFLQNSGYAFEMQKCVFCGGRLFSGRNFFSATRGGIICNACAGRESKKIAISDDAVKLMRIFFTNKMKNLSKISADKKTLVNLRAAAEEAFVWVV